MKRTEIKHLYNTQLNRAPFLTDYCLKENFLVRVPIGNILCGILFSPSGFSKKAFYIRAFTQPLYIPSDYLVLTFGLEMPGYWEYAVAEIDLVGPRVLKVLADHALPFHQRFSTLELFYRNAESTFSPKNIHLQQALVLTSIYLDKEGEAQEHFDTLRQLVDQSDPKIPWPRAVLDETQTFVSEAATDRKVVRAHLREVEVATRKNLRLNDLPAIPPLDGTSYT
jgi:hypothetical protein